MTRQIKLGAFLGRPATISPPGATPRRIDGGHRHRPLHPAGANRRSREVRHDVLRGRRRPARSQRRLRQPDVALDRLRADQPAVGAAVQTGRIGLVSTASPATTSPTAWPAPSCRSTTSAAAGRAGTWSLRPAHRSRQFRRDRPQAPCRSLRARARIRRRGTGFGRAGLSGHDGQSFSVRDPLDLPRSPQGSPVIVQAGASESAATLRRAPPTLSSRRTRPSRKQRPFTRTSRGAWRRRPRARRHEDHARRLARGGGNRGRRP